METNFRTAGAVTPVKDRSKASEMARNSENVNPNVTASPGLKMSSSPLTKSASKPHKSASKNPNPLANSPLHKNRIRERKFVVAKKSSRRDGLNKSAAAADLACKCDKGNGKPHKCLCVAYESLRASQEEFFKNRGESSAKFGVEEEKRGNLADEGEAKNDGSNQIPAIGKGCQEKVEESVDAARLGDEGINEMGVSAIKRTRDKLLEEALEEVPEPGSGRVMHLVKAFEKILSIPKSNGSEEKDEKDFENKVVKWALPGLQPPKAPETQSSTSSFCPSEFYLTSECLGLDSRRSSSLDSSRGRNSSESSETFARRRWRRRQQLKTTAKPFKLRTEERGKCKEEEFMKKVQHMLEEEEKLRIPIAQGLPWTTDEPECLMKPPVKEITRPVDLVLHSDVRAVDRAEFDQQVQEKLSLIEQYRMERERQQKLAEEEEIRRLRKELVPKAQPMPYFDRPFIPRRSAKNPTVPKEPKFHIPQHKKIKCIQSWSDM